MEIELEPTETEAHQPKMIQPDPTAEKALKLARAALALSVIGLVILGVMLYQTRSALTKITSPGYRKSFKDEVARSVSASLQTQLQALSMKEVELEGKLSESKGTSEKITAIETRLSQFEVELQKNEKLRAKVMAMEFKTQKPKLAPHKPMPLKKPKNKLKR